MNETQRAADGALLQGQVAIVTGAGSRAPGIGNGRAAATLLAASGARVALVDIIAEAAETTRRMIEDSGGTCIVIEADVGSEAACRAAVDAAWRAWGRLDVLVNNVGIAGPAGSVVDVDLAAWDRCLRINLTSMVLMSRFAIPRMIAGTGGSIVNMSSVFGLRGGSPSIAYSATKGAILSLTRAMATTHGPQGIRVNAIAPGYVYTPTVASQGLTDEIRRGRQFAAPLETEGSAWDVAEAVLYLASERSKWVTGVTLPVDAGLSSAVGFGTQMSVTSTPGARN